MNRKLSYTLILFILGFFISSTCYSQEATESFDKVIMLNGEEKIGKVMEMGEDYVKFTYKGESLMYTLKKSEINKIQFSSGRIEIITEAKKEEAGKSHNLQDHHNVVAILPFVYIGEGGAKDEKMSLKVQSDCYTLMMKKAGQFTFQDPMTTNALLAKQGITSDNISGYLPGELANILEVEYLVIGTVTLEKTGATSTGGSYYSGKDKGNKTTGFGLGTSSTTVNFNTAVDMKIYTDQGQNVFAKSHESVWPTNDAYMLTLQYLIKRTPLYQK